MILKSLQPGDDKIGTPGNIKQNSANNIFGSLSPVVVTFITFPHEAQLCAPGVSDFASRRKDEP